MKILLVEDDIFFQKFYSFKLTEQGFTVIGALDGEDGLVKLQAEDPDLVLLDLIMPNKNGFDFLEKKKNTPQNDVPVIIFSTLGQEEDIKKALSLGGRDYVNKSFFDFDKLLQKIKTFAQ